MIRRPPRSTRSEFYSPTINVAPQANKEQIQTLFGYIGKVEELKLYPTLRDLTVPVQVRICFIKFADSTTVGVAQHMSNTVFIDRALIVTPYIGSEIPDEVKGLEILNTGNGFGGLSEPKLPPTLSNQLEGMPPHQIIRTIDPRLAIHGLPPYPPLPASTDSRRLEEIRRTVVAMNLDHSASAQQVIDFFSSAGEVKYFRFCSREGDALQYALIEFTEQESIVAALKLNNKQLGDNIIKVHHSTQAIVKPPPQNKTNEAAQKEIEEAVNRVKEAQQSLLSASAAKDPAVGIVVIKVDPVHGHDVAHRNHVIAGIVPKKRNERKRKNVKKTNPRISHEIKTKGERKIEKKKTEIKIKIRKKKKRRKKIRRNVVARTNLRMKRKQVNVVVAVVQNRDHHRKVKTVVVHALEAVGDPADRKYC
nr:EOG090X0EEC [Cyclestheria hislopi]